MITQHVFLDRVDVKAIKQECVGLSMGWQIGLLVLFRKIDISGESPGPLTYIIMSDAFKRNRRVANKIHIYMGPHANVILDIDSRSSDLKHHSKH